MHRFLLSLCVLWAGCPGGLCGDGSLDEGEACDDNNLTNADGCEADCSLPACHNGILDPGEVCFFEPVTVETDIAPGGVVVADFNRDEALDLATANAGGRSLSILLGDGVGDLIRSSDIELGAIGFSLVVGDWDSDSIPDLAAALLDLDLVRVFGGLGDGSFVERAPLSTSPVPQLLAVGDFNADSKPDLVTGNFEGSSVDVFLNLGAGSFSLARTTATSSGVGGLAVGDFNGDGNQDLAAVLGGAEDSLVMLLGDGAGNLTPQAPQFTGQVPGDILAADLNRDGALDLVAGRLFGGQVRLFVGQGNGLFSETQTLSVRTPSALAVGDLDGDGVPDVAVASGLDQADNSHLGVFPQGETGSFASDPLLFSTGPSDLRGLILADFNGDGALDAALTDQATARVFVFFSQP